MIWCFTNVFLHYVFHIPDNVLWPFLNISLAYCVIVNLYYFLFSLSTLNLSLYSSLPVNMNSSLCTNLFRIMWKIAGVQNAQKSTRPILLVRWVIYMAPHTYTYLFGKGLLLSRAVAQRITMNSASPCVPDLLHDLQLVRVCVRGVCMCGVCVVGVMWSVGVMEYQ